MVSPSPSTIPASPRRRLSSRRGSISAFDPFAKHADINQKPERTSFSTLTIVRVPPQQPEQFSLHDPPPAGQRRPHQHHSLHHNHRRSGSGGNNGSPGGGSTRLSFAFSSFAPPGKTAQVNSGVDRPSSPGSSPSSSPRLRPSSPHQAHRSLSYGHGSSSAKPRLTPEQLYDVAHRATNPNLFTPGLDRARGGAHDHGQPQPATFTPLPPAVYLPFVDRPTEVAALISSPPTKKLFALLSQTFPRDNQNSSSIPSSPQPPIPSPNPTSGELSPTVSLRALPREAASVDITEIPSDPTKWTYTQLVAFMTQATRTIAPDALWVALLRKCILGRSELIWERVKGALGVPPELDVDLDIEFDGGGGDVFDTSSESEADAEEVAGSGTSSSSGPNTDDMEDEGRKAKGHWDDWDAVMDSPEFEKNQAQFSVIHQDKTQQDEFKARIDAALNDSIIEPSSLSGKPKAHAMERVGSNQSGVTTLSPTPRVSSPPGKKPQLPPIVAQHVQDNESQDTPTETTVPKIVQELPTPAASQDQFDVAAPIPIPGADLGAEKPSSGDPRKKKHHKSSSLSNSWLGGSISLSSPVSGPEDTSWPSTSADFGASLVDFGLSPSAGELGIGGSPYMGPTEPSDMLSIEPLLSPSQSGQITSPGLHPPPLSLPASLSFVADEGAASDTTGHGLGDIIEGEEEEEEEEKKDAGENKNDPSKAVRDTEDSPKELKKEGKPAIDPCLIQGLRLSLSSQPSSPAMSPSISSSSRVFWAGSNNNSESNSPTVPNRPVSWGSAAAAASRPSSRRSSFGYSPGLTRTGSTGSLTGMAMQLSGSYSEDESHGHGGYSYDPVSDRTPGNPLFPSNFARLATGPTLVANNPSLRARGQPSQPRYSHPRASLGLWNLKGAKYSRRGSFGASSVASDYAVTLASESVASGGNVASPSDAH